MAKFLKLKTKNYRYGSIDLSVLRFFRVFKSEIQFYLAGNLTNEGKIIVEMAGKDGKEKELEAAQLQVLLDSHIEYIN